MPTKVREELIRFVKSEDPVVQERQRHIAQILLEDFPDLTKEARKKARKKGRSEGRLVEARSALRRVLARRKLAITAEDDARIEACSELGVLERWHDEAIVASSVAEVFGSVAAT
jgi:hypothetical protein